MMSLIDGATWRDGKLGTSGGCAYDSCERPCRTCRSGGVPTIPCRYVATSSSHHVAVQASSRMREPAEPQAVTAATLFPAGARATVVPNQFFADVLPAIADTAELVVTVYLFYALGRKRGLPRFISFAELAAEAPLRRA